MEVAALINMMNYSLKTADEVIKFAVNKRFQHIHHWWMEVRKSQGLKYHRTEIILYSKTCIYNRSKSTEINWKLYDSKVKFGIKIIWQCPYILSTNDPQTRVHPEITMDPKKKENSFPLKTLVSVSANKAKSVNSSHSIL